MMRAAALAIAVLALAAGAALAVEPDEILADPALEARARAVSRDLRCMVCRSQSIDDSDAPLARDLRLLVRERIRAGDSNREVRDFIAARYGDYVLLKPRFGAATVALWAAPAAALLLAAAAAVAALRAKRKAVAPSPLTAEEVRRLDELGG
jgi:cytochrome c-type biogenesis protein CcmH